jgi:hypothetical protein
MTTTDKDVDFFFVTCHHSALYLDDEHQSARTVLYLGQYVRVYTLYHVYTLYTVDAIVLTTALSECVSAID